MDKNELYGQDIKLGDDMQPVVAASGEVVLTTGIETVLQDIKLRLFTLLGTLFYDKEFGSEILLYVKDENTLINRLGLCAEVVRCINQEPRAVVGSALCSVKTWNESGVTLAASFELIDEDHPYNLVITVDSDMEILIQDVNPN